MIKLLFNIELFQSKNPPDFMLMGVLGWIITIVIILIFLDEKRAKRRSYSNKSKKPNLIIEYIKAKKEKVCPRITLTD